jgi:hypothetical protein
VGPWLPCRGGHSCFRRDRFHRAHAHPGSVPGGTDFLIDRIHVARTDALRGVYLPACVLLTESILVPGHISAGGRVCILIGVHIPVADQVGIPELIPVRLPDPDPFPVSIGPPDSHPDLSHVLASIHADITVRSGTGFFVVERMPGGALSRGLRT